MLKKLLFLVSVFTFSLGFSQQQYLITENTKISILTVDVADEAHSLYGHTALRIQDSRTGIDLVYNYGMFDFKTDNFVLKFVKGDLQYFAAAYPYADYAVDDLWVWDQHGCQTFAHLCLRPRSYLFEPSLD